MAPEGALALSHSRQSCGLTRPATPPGMQQRQDRRSEVMLQVLALLIPPEVMHEPRFGDSEPERTCSRWLVTRCVDHLDLGAECKFHAQALVVMASLQTPALSIEEIGDGWVSVTLSRSEAMRTPAAVFAAGAGRKSWLIIRKPS
jgi:hypothetical protein